MIIRRGIKMKNKPSRAWNELRDEFLQDKEVKAEYEALRPQYELIKQVITARTKQGITQEELAQRAGTKQSNISRFEGGNYNPSLEFMQKLAHGLGKELQITLK
jgi:ribosome-binding protein aMBF1 (putative translation factor)